MKKKINNNFIERYSRQIVLKDIGAIGQKKIFNAKILIVGVGGLGCPVVDYLARAGVGNITIADNDKIRLSNIHRQSIYDTSDIGKLKVEIVKKKINRVNPHSKIKIIKQKITKLNVSKIIKKSYIVVD